MQLGISVHGVRNHLVRIRRRLGATDTAQAVYVATRDGILDDRGWVQSRPLGS